jgi:hypothetical protein
MQARGLHEDFSRANDAAIGSERSLRVKRFSWTAAAMRPSVTSAGGAVVIEGGNAEDVHPR